MDGAYLGLKIGVIIVLFVSSIVVIHTTINEIIPCEKRNGMFVSLDGKNVCIDKSTIKIIDLTK